MRTKVRNTRSAWWLTISGPIRGYEGEGEGGEGAGDGQGTGEGAPGEGDGSQEGEGEGNGGGDDTAGLKSALDKERRDRKALEKELATHRKSAKAAEDAEKTEVQRLTDAQTANAEKVTRLATKFRTNAVREAIIAAAGQHKFLDPSDAVTADVIAAIGVEQDEDDPSEVTIDAATVQAAVKELAKKKPHWLSTQAPAPKQKPKSGSSFGGAQQGKTPGDEDAAIKAMFPALQNR